MRFDPVKPRRLFLQPFRQIAPTRDFLRIEPRPRGLRAIDVWRALSLIRMFLLLPIVLVLKLLHQVNTADLRLIVNQQNGSDSGRKRCFRDLLA